jgi:hypothetical protein
MGMLFTGFLCRCVGGVLSLFSIFPVIFSLVLNFLLSNDSNRAEFIGEYSASDPLVIFMFSSKA